MIILVVVVVVAAAVRRTITERYEGYSLSFLQLSLLLSNKIWIIKQERK
jgi:hypothetical protein